MTYGQMNDFHRKRSRRKIKQTHGVIQGALDGVWHWLNGVASGIGHLFGSSVDHAIKTVLETVKEMVHLWWTMIKTVERIQYWVQLHVLKFLWHLIWKQVARLIAMMRDSDKRIIRLIYVVSQSVLAAASGMVRRERAARVRQFNTIKADIRRAIKAEHALIEREAAQGYKVDQRQRTAIIVRLLDFAAAREPLIKGAVTDVATALLDLLAIDDPIARWILGFAIRDIIDKLGIDKAVGHLIADLLAPYIGQRRPKDLHDVIMDLSQRLTGTENQWARFMEDGGSQVEQAGKEWRNITSIGGALAVVGFVGFAVAEPEKWADGINNIVGARANELADKAVSLFGG